MKVLLCCGKIALLAASIKNLQNEPLPPPQRDDGGGFLLRGPHPVSPAGSGPAPRWGASRTDGRGNRDRPLGNVSPVRSGPHRGSRDWSPPGGEVSSQRDDGGGFLSRGSHPRLACRLGRFAAERHWRSLTPLPLISFVVRGNLAATGGGILFFFSQGGLWPPWESPFSMGPASLHGGGVLKILERPSAEGFSCPCPHESSLTAVQTYLRVILAYARLTRSKSPSGLFAHESSFASFHSLAGTD